jgi:hypothetical protein
MFGHSQRMSGGRGRRQQARAEEIGEVTGEATSGRPKPLLPPVLGRLSDRPGMLGSAARPRGVSPAGLRVSPSGILAPCHPANLKNYPSAAS